MGEIEILRRVLEDVAAGLVTKAVLAVVSAYVLRKVKYRKRLRELI